MKSTNLGGFVSKFNRHSRFFYTASAAKEKLEVIKKSEYIGNMPGSRTSAIWFNYDEVAAEVSLPGITNRGTSI